MGSSEVCVHEKFREADILCFTSCEQEQRVCLIKQGSLLGCHGDPHCVMRLADCGGMCVQI